MVNLDQYTLHEIKQSESLLVETLREAGAIVRGRTVTCCLCDDKHPSAGIYSPDGGGMRYKCNKCGFNGSIVDVIAAIDGVAVTEVFKRLRTGPAKSTPKVYPTLEALQASLPGKVESVFKYLDPITGKIDLVIFRLIVPEGKSFRQATLVSGGYIQQSCKAPRPLYNRKLDSDTVVVVEGEKCVDALQKHGFTATTSPAGAKGAKYADWIPLANKNVIIWPDNDADGRKYAEDVEAILRPLEPAPRIAMIEPNNLDLKEKEDVFDYIEQLEVIGEDVPAAIHKVLAGARIKGIAQGVSNLIEDCISGKREAIRWPWSCLGGLSKALLPGTVTLFCGNVGASKSFALLQAAQYWRRNGIKIALYELEENRDYHLSRCLAQVAKNAGMTDPEYIKSEPETARTVFKDNEDFLNSFGSCIYAAPEIHPTHTQVAKWIDDRAKAGCRVIAIDPVTACLQRGTSVAETDSIFLRAIAKTATDYQCSIVVITHPIKFASFPNVGELQGGASYQRFCQTILWLESHKKKTGQVATACGPADAKYNRTLHILKARNGKGQGVRLACIFESDSLTLTETGIIVRENK